MGSIIAFLSIIVMIILHEWGHFIAARIFKLPVYEFAVGMGPLICSRKDKKGTKFSLRAIPIGGFCAFDDAENSGIQDTALNNIPIWQKIIICVAGPLMNLFTGFLIFLILTITIGVGSDTNTVYNVLEDFPAYNIFQEGDIITYIDGVKIDNIDNTISSVVKEAGQKELDITFIRDGVERSITMTPKYDEATKRCYIGVQTKSVYRKAEPSEYFEIAWNLTKGSVVQVYSGLRNLFTGKVKLTEMSGIIGIVSYANEYATLATIYSFVGIMAVVSINLGIMNLLPIPGLDGSKILIGILELLRGGKRFPEEVEAKLITGSFYLLLALMIFVAINDVIKIIFK